MLRQSLLWLSEQQGVFNFVRTNSLARKFASRFVAGETVEQAVAAALELHRHGMATSLDLLGESVSREAEAAAAKDQYVSMLRLLAAGNLDVNVSVKLTQMGLDVDEAACARNVRTIVEQAAEHDGFVRLDMESSEYTQRTIDFYFQHVPEELKPHCGLVIQSSLRRSVDDVDSLVERQIRVRLCKGAYLEPDEVAFHDKADVDRTYVEMMEQLLDKGNYPGIATHDERIIDHARKFVEQRGIPPERYEFQMLYGVRRDLQRQLRAAGHRLRVYVPFGGQWYPYLMRRLAERPANIAFMLGNIVRESVPGL
jgi:proline dehydrogenase